jgi:hypothetical protein
MAINVTVVENLDNVNVNVSSQSPIINISVDQLASERAVQAAKEAKESAEQAKFSEDNALISAESALLSEQEANQAKEDAELAKVEAENARDTAIEAKDDAEIARDEAVQAKNEILPIIPLAEQIADLNLLLSTFTVELIDGLSVDFYAPFAIKINSTTNISGSPTIAINVNNASYTLGNTIAQGAKVTVIASVIGVVNLNIEYVI